MAGALSPPESGPAFASLGGAGFIPGIPRLGIPDLQMADAAVGVTRGAQKSRYSTPLPSCGGRGVQLGPEGWRTTTAR